MKDRYTMIFPNYTIGVEAYEKIREVCPRYGKSVVVIGGRKGIEAAQEKMVRAVEGVGLEFTGFIHAGGQSSDENIERISEDSAVQEADMIFAVGGGKAIDTAKAVAHRQNKPYFTFPTVAGSCAAAASIATIYTPDGKFQDYLYSTIPPVHVFLCSRIMAQAPVEYLLRGIGDTMAKYYEAAIASRGRKLQHRAVRGQDRRHECRHSADRQLRLERYSPARVRQGQVNQDFSRFSRVYENPPGPLGLGDFAITWTFRQNTNKTWAECGQNTGARVDITRDDMRFLDFSRRCEKWAIRDSNP
mgnify:CR=1 FL=1